MPLKLSDLTEAAAVEAALNEFSRLGQSAFLRKYGFGRASGYLVQDPRSGLWADSKAIAGVALSHQHLASPALKPSEFSGGVATVVRKLESLGFVVQSATEITGEPWQRDEVELIVDDYLSMLLSELAGQPYSKTRHRRQLLSVLPGRSEGSIEFKHCNISAVLIELGCPYVQGYQPRRNFQRQLLVEVVSEKMARHTVLDEVALSAVERPAVQSVHTDFSRALTDAPQRQHHVREPQPAYSRPPVRRDYLAREEHNRSLGQAGEVFALEFERWRLAQLGVGQLAERVTHASLSQGDGLGYDIHSFEIDGRDRFIEVKTTSFGERTPFFVSTNELEFARQHSERYRLYRLFDFRRLPRLFELSGPIDQHCDLDAISFRASFG
jgi:Domain of unknown function (DUF3883)